MPYIIILFLFISFSNCYASDFFAPNIYTSNNITLSYSQARDYHFKSSNPKKYSISSYNDYTTLLDKDNSLNLSLDYLHLAFSIGDDNFVAFMLIGTSNDSLMRPDGKGAAYISIWKQQGDKYMLLAANEIYAIYGASLFFDDESNIIVIDSPMGQCEVLFLKTSLFIKDNNVYYKSIEKSTITPENTMENETLFSSDNKVEYLLNKKNGLEFLP